jgi:hypothetical protein
VASGGRERTLNVDRAPELRLHREWRNRVIAEYRSSALAAQVLHWMIQAALPDELLRTAIRIVGDELDHAHLSHECLVALGGVELPAAIDVASLADPAAPEGPLASLVDAIGRNFCLGETFAVPLFSAMRAGTTHPTAAAVLDRVLRDEAVHRAFGWDALDELLERGEPGVRERMRARLPDWLAGYERAYGTVRPAPPITDAELAAGLLPMSRYVEVYREALSADVLPRLARRGLAPL